MSCVSDFLASLPSSGTSYTAEGRGWREGAGVVLRIQIYTQQVLWILFNWEGKLKLGWENKAVHSSVPLLTIRLSQQNDSDIASYLLQSYFFFLLCFGRFLYNISVEHCMKIAKDQVYTTLHFTARRVLCCC